MLILLFFSLLVSFDFASFSCEVTSRPCDCIPLLIYCTVLSFIEPRQGMDADFDAATAEEEDAKQALESVLSELKGGPLRGSGVKWFHHKTKLDDQYQVLKEWGWVNTTWKKYFTYIFVCIPYNSRHLHFAYMLFSSLSLPHAPIARDPARLADPPPLRAPRRAIRV